jgi:hypothetical protein
MVTTCKSIRLHIIEHHNPKFGECNFASHRSITTSTLHEIQNTTVRSLANVILVPIAPLKPPLYMKFKMESNTSTVVGTYLISLTKICTIPLKYSSIWCKFNKHGRGAGRFCLIQYNECISKMEYKFVLTLRV